MNSKTPSCTNSASEAGGANTRNLPVMPLLLPVVVMPRNRRKTKTENDQGAEQPQQRQQLRPNSLPVHGAGERGEGAMSLKRFCAEMALERNIDQENDTQCNCLIHPSSCESPDQCSVRRYQHRNEQQRKSGQLSPGPWDSCQSRENNTKLPAPALLPILSKKTMGSRQSSGRWLAVLSMLFILLASAIAPSNAQNATEAPPEGDSIASNSTNPATSANSDTPPVVPDSDQPEPSVPTVSPLPTAVPSVLPQRIETSQPTTAGGPVIASTNSALFSFKFLMIGSDSSKGLLNATQRAAFEELMRNTTQLFAPNDYQLVTTVCTLVVQEQVEQTQLTNAPSNETLSLVPNDGRNRKLGDNMTSTTTSIGVEGTDNGTAVISAYQRYLQDGGSNATEAPQTEPPSTAAPSQQEVVQENLFQYIFGMNYFSTNVDISGYPQQFETFLIEEIPSVSDQLAALLGVPPLNVAITEIAQVSEGAAESTAPTSPTDPPTFAPTSSAAPSLMPTISAAPSTSFQPSMMPSVAPTGMPTGTPSSPPSMAPTFGNNVTEAQNYQLEFTLQGPDEIGFLNETQELQFCEFMENLTVLFDPESRGYVTTTCRFLDAISRRTTQAGRRELQSLRRQLYRRRRWWNDNRGVNSSSSSDRWWMPRWVRRVGYYNHSSYGFGNTTSMSIGQGNLDDEEARRLQVTVIYTYNYFFRMVWVSDVINVTQEAYPNEFSTYFASNAGPFQSLLEDALNLTANNNLTLKGISTFETASEEPSSAPTSVPSAYPSKLTTLPPTPIPSTAPTVFVPSREPTTMPSNVPSSAPTAESNDTVIIVVAVVVALFGSAVLLALVWFYKIRQSKRTETAATSGSVATGTVRGDGSVPNAVTTGSVDTGMMMGYAQSSSIGGVAGSAYNSNGMPYPYDTNAPLNDNSNRQQTLGSRILMSPSGESILSNPSLLSNGQDDDDLDHNDDSDDDMDQLHGQSKLSPLDDFDQFKDQNLEKMRAGVENSVANMDGMMSQALTMALMGGSAQTASDLWGGAESGIEIEVNALCEVNDWVKRHDEASHDEKQSFMQHMLNKMVTSVRQNLLSPEDASRTVHECALILSLQVADDLPLTTLILTGMRKTVKANDVIRAFRRFGPIDDAAVASNERGFGIVRFRNQKAVQQVMIKFRTSEIVVQDVAVQVKVLRAQDLATFSA